MPRQITAFSNDDRQAAALAARQEGAARAEGLFLAEGLRIIAEARDSGRLPEIIAFSAAGRRHPLAAEIIAAAEAAARDAIETTPDILSKMSGKDNPQTLLGAYRQPDTALERDRPRRRRRCGSSPRRCAIRAISAPSCAPATRSAPAG